MDEMKEKSAKRQAEFAVEGGTHDVRNEDHHKVLPREVKEKLLDTAKEVDNLHLTFDKFTLQTQSAVLSLHESQERVLALRRDASIPGNANMFEQIKENQKDKNRIFGSRGSGIYQDSVLNQIEEIVAQRTV